MPENAVTQEGMDGADISIVALDLRPVRNPSARAAGLMVVKDSSADPNVRRGILQTLTQAGDLEPGFREALIVLIQSPGEHASVRIAAVEAMLHLAFNKPEDTLTLQKTLSDQILLERDPHFQRRLLYEFISSSPVLPVDSRWRQTLDDHLRSDDRDGLDSSQLFVAVAAAAGKEGGWFSILSDYAVGPYDQKIRQGAVAAMGNVSPQSPSFTDALNLSGRIASTADDGTVGMLASLAYAELVFKGHSQARLPDYKDRAAKGIQILEKYQTTLSRNPRADRLKLELKRIAEHE